MDANKEKQKIQTYTDRLTDELRKLSGIKLTAARELSISANLTIQIV